ncbi:GntR family transcriptional regulator [Pokkaliibacter sp. CJK22405]|uniref:GntR family transcriptional regulator n=1 Tax=Pokkaliibacter sp. CJK22405 TaxID=3384615 RepID=UPI0039853C00
MAASFIGQDSRLPLYQQIRDDMLSRIANREWIPGQPIPTEAELTQRYGVAVGTLRKAVDTLVQDGLLERNQGRGTFIRRPNFNASFFRFFRQLNAAGSHEVPQSLITSRTLEAPSAEIRAALSLAEGEQVIHLERQRLLGGEVVFVEDIWLAGNSFAPLMDIDPSEYGNLLYPFYEESCGQLIGSAKETLSVSTADESTAKKLSVETGAPIAIIERTALSYARQPLEYRLTRGAAGTFRYQIEIS